MTNPTPNLRRPMPARRIDTQTHAFRHGQSVRLKNTVVSSGHVYLITASLPTNGASPQYRIRNSEENFERMASEADLELFSPPSRDAGEAAIDKLFGGAPAA